jgi:single-strand DNA-binding protein
MVSYNSVCLIGNVGTTPELRYTPSGQGVCSFTMATNRSYKAQNGERKEETTWHNIVVWGKSAEWANTNINKGSLVFVEGRISNRSWEGNDGVKHYKTEIIANKVSSLERKPNSGKTVQDNDGEEIEPDEIPF